MKRFKLIKEYPGFKGDIGVIATQIDNSHCQIDSDEKDLDLYMIDYFTSFPENWQEIKEPLFVTEDGKEFFELNGNIYEVSLPSYSYSGFLDLSDYGKLDFEYIIKIRSNNKKYFSSKEALGKWIDENKPVFSKKQLRDVINDASFQTGANFLFKNEVIKALDL